MSGRSGGQREDGLSLIEVLFAVVLLGGAVIAILSLTTATIRSSSVNRDVVNTQALVASAIERVSALPRVPCRATNPGAGTPDYTVVASGAGSLEAIRLAYEAAARQATLPTPDPDWTDARITIKSPVEMWNGTAWQTTNCYEVSFGDPNYAAICQGADPLFLNPYCDIGNARVLQKVTIEVTSPSGLVETVELVKR